MAFTVTLPAQYGYVLVMVLSFALYVTLVGFFKGGATRKETFDFETMLKFEKQHKEAGIEAPLDKQGYPDNGCGRYSKELGYKEWIEFNSG